MIDLDSELLSVGADLDVEIGLPEPELSASVAGLACPNCGSLRNRVQEVEDAEVELSREFDAEAEDQFFDMDTEVEKEPCSCLVCLDCSCEFAAPSTQSAISVIDAVIESRANIVRLKSIL